MPDFVPTRRDAVLVWAVDLVVGRDRGDRESGGKGRRFTVPALGFRVLHRRHERLVDLWEFGIFARLVELLAAAAAGGKARRRGERCEEVEGPDHAALLPPL